MGRAPEQLSPTAASGEGETEVGSRWIWPGRNLKQNSPPRSEAGSDIGSIAGLSMTGSVAGMAPEERAEFKKLQTCLAAAGTLFSKELREIRKDVTQLRDGLDTVHSKIGLGS